MRTRPTLERHGEIGARLEQIHSELQTLSCEIGNAYGSSSRETEAFDRTLRGLARLRSTLDDAVFREHDAACAHIYYPAGDVELPHRC